MFTIHAANYMGTNFNRYSIKEQIDSKNDSKIYYNGPCHLHFAIAR